MLNGNGRIGENVEKMAQAESKLGLQFSVKKPNMAANLTNTKKKQENALCHPLFLNLPLFPTQWMRKTLKTPLKIKNLFQIGGKTSTPFANLTGWIDFTDGTLSETPVQVDNGTNQDSLLPDQTKPSAPAESTPTPPPTTEIPAPVDCRQELSEWEEWSDCRYGKRSRGRSLTTYPAENGGEPCGPRPVLTEKEDCEEEPIGSLCGFGAWDSWSEWDCRVSPWSQGGDWYMIRTRKRYTTYLLTKEDDYRVSPSLAKCRKEHPLEDTMENGIGIADHIEWLNDDESSGVMVQVQTERQKCPPCQEGYVRSDKEANFSQCEPLPVEEPASSGGGGGQTATTPAATTTETTEEEEETTTEEPEEDSNGLKIVGGLAVLSGIGYWAYKKYA